LRIKIAATHLYTSAILHHDIMEATWLAELLEVVLDNSLQFFGDEVMIY